MDDIGPALPQLSAEQYQAVAAWIEDYRAWSRDESEKAGHNTSTDWDMGAWNTAATLATVLRRAASRF